MDMDTRKHFRATFGILLILILSVLLRSTHAKTDIPVFLLTGQSNMSGYASANDLTADQRQEVGNVKIYADMTWEGDNAKERKWLTLGPGFGSGAGRIGPELSMGRALSEQMPDTKIALLKICCGSTYLGLLQFKANDCWVPPSSNNGNAGTHYQRMLSSIETALGKFNDAYEVNLTNLINDVRSDLEVDDLPIIIPMIDVQNSWPYNATVRAAEVAVTRKMDNVDTLDTRGFETDGAHYRAQGQVKIGTITAQRWIAMDYEYRTPVVIGGDNSSARIVKRQTAQFPSLPQYDLAGRKVVNPGKVPSVNGIRVLLTNGYKANGKHVILIRK